MSKMFIIFVIFTLIFVECCVCPDNEVKHLGNYTNKEARAKELADAKEWANTTGKEAKDKQKREKYALNWGSN